MPSYTCADSLPDIFPDYSNATIPGNIAPLNFRINDKITKHIVRFVAGRDSFELSCREDVAIPVKKWKKILQNNLGTQLTIRIFAQQSTGWIKYRDVSLQIAPDPIDPYIVYRLINPGYEYWSKMGIYQRDIESFSESPVLINSVVDGACMNCHSFCGNNPEKMLFHIRAQHAGTILKNNDQIVKLDTKIAGQISAAVYPRWHPEGRYIAFSTNQTAQAFHAKNDNLIEVYDSASDLIIYDTETESMYTHPMIHAADKFETFPEWSPDGKTLYFCSASAATMPESYDSLRYDLLSVTFDAQTGKFGNRVDTVLQSSKMGKSTAFPRVSPDGKYMLVCLSNFGTFPIWHQENDLYLLDMQTGNFIPMDNVNSEESDSYHSWSSNGRWIVFGSRRIDGLYTRLYLAYFDRQGQFHHPFLLPQKNPAFYNYSLKSYNIPEFITNKIKTPPRTFERVAKDKAKKL